MTVYLSNRDGNGKTNEEGHYRLQTRVYEGNVLFVDDLKVKQNSPLGMSVLVSLGDYRLETSSGYSYTGWIDVDTAVTITTADPANPRITTIILYVDKGATTSASPPNNPGIAKLLAVNGTPAASPTAPNGTTLQSAAGAGNPYMKLAEVLVGTGVTQITNANITDFRTKLTLVDNVVDTSSIINASVTNAKMATNSVDNAQLVANAVTNAKIANNTIAGGKLDYSTFIYGRLYLGGAAAGAGGFVIGPNSGGIAPYDTLDSNSKGGVTKPSNGLLLIPTTGVYVITASMGMADVPNANTLIRITADPAGGTPGTGQGLTPWANLHPYGTNNRGGGLSAVKLLTAGTTVGLWIYNNTGAAIRYNWWENRDEAALALVRIA